MLTFCALSFSPYALALEGEGEAQRGFDAIRQHVISIVHFPSRISLLRLLFSLVFLRKEEGDGGAYTFSPDVLGEKGRSVTGSFLITPTLLQKALELLEEGISSDCFALPATLSTKEQKEEESELRKAIKDLRQRFELIRATSSNTSTFSITQPTQGVVDDCIEDVLSDSHSFFNRAMDQNDFRMARLVVNSDTFALPKYRLVCCLFA